VAELTAFDYRPGASLLHRLDVRMKLALVAVFSAGSLYVGLAGAAVLGAFLVGVCLWSGASPAVHAGGLRWLAGLLLFVFAARALSTDGSVVLAVGPAAVTREGLADGLLTSLRLAVVFLIGAVFAATTRASAVKAGVQWYLKPLPLVPAERVGTMLGLLVRFVPLMFAQVAAVSEAQRARGLEHRRPLRRMVLAILPAMRRVFEVSDRLALAMEARCYSESRTPPELAACRRDWTSLGCCLTILALALAV
jgi:energy-coupling factor transporter transmembrane protein EcfT